MPVRHPDKLKTLEQKFRGLAIEDSLRDAAAALAARAGTAMPPPRRDRTQFPFEAAVGQNLRQMELRYGTLFESAPDPMVVVNASGEITTANAAAGTRFDYSHDELIGTRIAAILNGPILDAVIDLGLEAGLRTAGERAAAGIELVGIRQDGSRFPLEATFSLADDGEREMLIVALRDISLHKAAQSRLAEAEFRARSLFDALPIAVLVLNRRGRIVSFSRRAEQLLGFAHGELAGKPAEAVLSEALARQVIESRAPAGAPLRLEGNGRRQDGSGLPLEAVVGLHEDDQGAVLLVALHDLAPTEAAAERVGLRAMLLDAAPDPIIAIDRYGDIVSANRQATRRFGYQGDGLLGEKFADLVPDIVLANPSSGTMGVAALELAREIGAGMELTGRRSDGSRFPVEITLANQETSDGVLTIAIIRDISVRKAAERHLAARSEPSAGPSLTLALPEARGP